MPDRLSHIPPNDDELRSRPSADELMASSGGVERASPELLALIAQKRDVTFAPPGSDIERYLNSIPAEAAVSIGGNGSILFRENPSKTVVLEEFLHGVQSDIGIQQRLGTDFAEWHVNDFMIRNAAKLNLIPEDVQRLEENRAYYASLDGMQDKIDSEAARKASASAELRSSLTARAEHHAARGVGTASLAVNAAEGNYGAAAMDAAGLVAENGTVQKAATEVATKVIGAELLEAGVKKIPLVGAAVTVGTVLYASGAQAWNGHYALAAGELAVGIPEAAGNIVGFGLGDAARETARQGLIAAGGDDFAAVEKSGLRQLGEAGYALVTGRPVGEVLPPSHASMAQGADAMGERSEVGRIAIERAGTAQGHMIVLQDGSVQPGAVPFGNNPQIAAGKNGGTLGVLYAGTGAMNEAQWSTVQQVNDWLSQQRQSEGLSGHVEMIAGSTASAELNNLPTPRGPLPTAASPQVAIAPVQNRLRISNGM